MASSGVKRVLRVQGLGCGVRGLGFFLLGFGCQGLEKPRDRIGALMIHLALNHAKP